MEPAIGFLLLYLSAMLFLEATQKTLYQRLQSGCENTDSQGYKRAIISDKCSITRACAQPGVYGENKGFARVEQSFQGLGYDSK